MRLVSEKSDPDFRANQALDELKLALRGLAANILRVTRGAGSSAQLADQMFACLRAMSDYHDAKGHGVASWDLDKMLDPEDALAEHCPPIERDDAAQALWEDSGKYGLELADEAVRRASLRVAAAMLLGQSLQLRNAQDDFSQAILSREDAQERRRAYLRSRFPAGPRGRRKKK